MIQYEFSGVSGSIWLSGTVGIKEAAELTGVLSEAIAHQGAVAVGATGLEAADASLLQLLLSAGLSCQRQGKDWSVFPSAALREAADLAGIASEDLVGWRPLQ